MQQETAYMLMVEPSCSATLLPASMHHVTTPYHTAMMAYIAVN